MKTIKEVEPTKRRYNTWLPNEEAIQEYVEEPLQKACKIFWDKGIKTSGSSANKQNLDYGTPAFIMLDYLSLSSENQKHAQDLIKAGKAEMIWNDTAVSLNIPVEESTPTQHITEEAIKFAEGFDRQAPNWIPVYSQKSVDTYPKFFRQEFYHDEYDNLFYLSKDHYEMVQAQKEKDPTWAPHYTLQQLIRDQLTNEGRVASDFDNYDPKYDDINFWVEEKGFNYDEKTKYFTLSEFGTGEIDRTSTSKAVDEIIS